MCAKDLRSLSQSFHLAAFLPAPAVVMSTGRLCHITPRLSGTEPSFLRLMVLTRAPNGPVICFAGMRDVRAMWFSSGGVVAGAHQDTGPPAAVTHPAACSMSRGRRR